LSNIILNTNNNNIPAFFFKTLEKKIMLLFLDYTSFSLKENRKKRK